MVLVSLMSRFFSTTSSQIILTSKNCHNHIPPRPNPFYSDYHVTRLTNNTATNMSAYQDCANPFYGSDYHVTLLTNQWRTQGRGPGGPGPPFIFRPNWRGGGRTPPPCLRVWMTPPPLSQGLDPALPTILLLICQLTMTKPILLCLSCNSVDQQYCYEYVSLPRPNPFYSDSPCNSFDQPCCY